MLSPASCRWLPEPLLDSWCPLWEPKTTFNITHQVQHVHSVCLETTSDPCYMHCAAHLGRLKTQTAILIKQRHQTTVDSLNLHRNANFSRSTYLFPKQPLLLMQATKLTSLDDLAAVIGARDPAILELKDFLGLAGAAGLAPYLEFDFSCVRGLAYYTGPDPVLHSLRNWSIIVNGDPAPSHAWSLNMLPGWLANYRQITALAEQT